MVRARSHSEFSPDLEEYKDLAKEALESVAVYNARVQYFEVTGNKRLAREYRQLSLKALERAQRYKDLVAFAEKKSA